MKVSIKVYLFSLISIVIYQSLTSCHTHTKEVVSMTDGPDITKLLSELEKESPEVFLNLLKEMNIPPRFYRKFSPNQLKKRLSSYLESDLIDLQQVKTLILKRFSEKVKIPNMAKTKTKDNPKDIIVPQGCFSVLTNENILDYGLKTTGVSPCVAVAISITKNEKIRFSLAHMDSETKIEESIQRMTESLKATNIKHKLKAWVAGGDDLGKKDYEEVIKTLQNQKIEIVEQYSLSEHKTGHIDIRIAVINDKVQVNFIEEDKNLDPKRLAKKTIHHGIHSLVSKTDINELFSQLDSQIQWLKKYLNRANQLLLNNKVKNKKEAEKHITEAIESLEIAMLFHKEAKKDKGLIKEEITRLQDCSSKILENIIKPNE